MNRIKTKKFWMEGEGSFAVAILFALMIRWALLEAYVIPSGSMLPSLLINDHIFVNKIVYGVRVPFTEQWMIRLNEPQRGEVIVFKYPEDMSIFYIKRVVGVPGDRVFYENGNLYVNDELVEKVVPSQVKSDFDWVKNDIDELGVKMGEGYVHWQETLGNYTHSILLKRGDELSINAGPYTVPDDSFFVMGDNRDNSRDSRYWAPAKRFVPRANLVGRASFVWLSCDEKLPVITFLCNPLTIRWKRFFHSVH